MKIRSKIVRIIFRNTKQSDKVEFSRLTKDELKAVDIELEGLLNELEALFKQEMEKVIGEDEKSEGKYRGAIFHNPKIKWQNKLRAEQRKKLK